MAANINKINLEKFMGEKENENWQLWLKRYETTIGALANLDAGNVRDLTCIRYIPTMLQGHAFSSFMQLEDDQKDTWDHAKIALTDCFNDPVKKALYKTFPCRKPIKAGQTYEAFKAEIINDVENNFDDANNATRDFEKYRRFIAGLPKHLQEYILLFGQESTIDGAVNMANKHKVTTQTQGYEDDDSTRRVKFNLGAAQTRGAEAPAQPGMETLITQMQNLNTTLTGKFDEVQKEIKQEGRRADQRFRNLEEAVFGPKERGGRSPTRRPTADRSRSPSCFNCGRLGHLRRDCRSPARKEGAETRLAQTRCFKCGETGHFANSCPTKVKIDTALQERAAEIAALMMQEYMEEQQDQDFQAGQ